MEIKDIMIIVYKSILWNVFKNFVSSNKIEIPNLIYSISIVFQLNHLEYSEILSLSTYLFNEDIINEIIDIHENINNNIEISDKQRMKNIIIFKENFAIIRQNKCIA